MTRRGVMPRGIRILEDCEGYIHVKDTCMCMYTREWAGVSAA